jgi:hypothetical protein
VDPELVLALQISYSSPILAEGQESGFGSVASGASGFEFGVDPELLLALQEEERARQEAAGKKSAEGSNETESTGQSQSSTSSDDTVMVEVESEPNLCTDDKRNLQKVC